MPTFWPIQKYVPRWRTTIVPDRTYWPSDRFTPSRFDSLSRPLRELPTPFLCAIVQTPLRASASGVDRRDRHAGQRLAMPGPPPVPLLWLVFEHHDLRTAILLFDGRANRCTGDDRRANPGRTVTTQHQHAIEDEVRTSIRWKLLDRESIADRHPILLATGFDDGVGG